MLTAVQVDSNHQVWWVHGRCHVCGRHYDFVIHEYAHEHNNSSFECPCGQVWSLKEINKLREGAKDNGIEGKGRAEAEDCSAGR